MKGAELDIIAYAHNGFSDKFGIPRQAQSLSHIETRIVFTPKYRVREALRGIEGFSHLWLIWGFSENMNSLVRPGDRTSLGFLVRLPTCRDNTSDRTSLGWSPTVRPPRLGGNKRMGVFATRSPFRPNPIGLSSVQLVRVEETAKEGAVLVVAGADLMDGTPIYDIKPYLAYADSHPDARDGFAEATKDYRLAVVWGEGIVLPASLQQALEEILAQDPRPAYQHDPQRVYKMEFGGVRVHFRVEDSVVQVEEVEKTADL
ncbi:MAG: tRNA (N6-threonylcarbamoyladenosine(37)-N6)-methyltransferase TrmO [Paludibacteraceae bacterium]|nr:tRNA (N6-threonylcarbamoyladenosine(37)-N6)-methyltransferase TrmO [Paludibacteraceae bacterium]